MWLCQHLDFRHLASRTVRENISCFQSPGVCNLLRHPWETNINWIPLSSCLSEVLQSLWATPKTPHPKPSQPYSVFISCCFFWLKQKLSLVNLHFTFNSISHLTPVYLQSCSHIQVQAGLKRKHSNARKESWHTQYALPRYNGVGPKAFKMKANQADGFDSLLSYMIPMPF